MSTEDLYSILAASRLNEVVKELFITVINK